MAFRLSTGLRNELLKAGGKSFADAFANMTIHLYSGGQPASADAAETGAKLAEITLSSGAFTPGSGTNGLNFDTAASGVLSKAAGEVWSGLGLAAASTGTIAGYARFYANDVTTGASTTAIRFDMAIATSGTAFQMSNTTIVSGAGVTVDTAQITLPAA